MERAVLVEGCWVSSARVHGRWCLLRGGGAVSALLSVADPTPKVPHHPSNISTSARKEGPFVSVLSVDRCVLLHSIVSIHVQVLHSCRSYCSGSLLTGCRFSLPQSSQSAYRNSHIPHQYSR